MWLNSLVDKNSKLLMSKLNKPSTYDNARMREVLEIEPRDVQQSILDTAYSMIQLGVVKKSKKMKKQELSTEGQWLLYVLSLVFDNSAHSFLKAGVG